MSAKIIILGAGQVGSSVAEILCNEGNDVTIIDNNPQALQQIKDRLDLRALVGSASSPNMLSKANAEDADLVLALTNSDEVNMVTCQVASTLFRTPTKMARIRSSDFLKYEKLFDKKAIPIDVIISPEEIVTEQISRLIEYPGALQVIDFANGKVRMVGVRAYRGGALVGHKLLDLRTHLPDANIRVAAIYRQGRGIFPTGDTVIAVDDEVFFIASREDIKQVMAELQEVKESKRHVFISGAGNIGFRLARNLERAGYWVKLVERNPERARWASEHLDKTVVINADAADEEILREENIDNMGLYCALTNADEANILSAMLAKRLGVNRAMAIINRSAYIDLIENDLIDIAISPRDATVSALLSHVRMGDVVAAHSLRRGAAEAIEAIAHGDRSSSKLVGRKLSEIELPKGTTVGAILRDGELLVWHKETVIEENDHLILFLVDKQKIPEVEQLFQVSAAFF